MLAASFLVELIESSVEVAQQCLNNRAGRICPLGIVNAALLRSVEILGQSIKDLPEGFVTAAAEAGIADIDWRGLKGIRDILAHRYYEIDIERVWSEIEPQIGRINAGMDQLRTLAMSFE